MRVNKIRFKINIDFEHLSEEDFYSTISDFVENIRTGDKFDFNKLNRTLILSGRNYDIISVNMPNLKNDDSIPLETTIEIRG